MKNNGISQASKKSKGALVKFARTIGSTLGTLVAKAGAPAKPLRRRTANRKPGPKVRKSPKRVGA